jgi:hypothetical protein
MLRYSKICPNQLENLKSFANNRKNKFQICSLGPIFIDYQRINKLLLEIESLRAPGYKIFDFYAIATNGAGFTCPFTGLHPSRRSTNSKGSHMTLPAIADQELL